MGIHKVSNVVTAYLDNDDSPDIENPIHSTEIARAYGYDGPLIGGVTVWGWATDTIIEAIGKNWLSEDGPSIRFVNRFFLEMFSLSLSNQIQKISQIIGMSRCRLSLEIPVSWGK